MCVSLSPHLSATLQLRSDAAGGPALCGGGAGSGQLQDPGAHPHGADEAGGQLLLGVADGAREQ